MFCNKCGKQIEDNSTFCANCGAAVLIPGVTPSKTIADHQRAQSARQTAQRAPEQPHYELAVPSAPKKKVAAQLPPTVGPEIKAKRFKKLSADMPFSASVALTGVPGANKIVKEASKQHDLLYQAGKSRKEVKAQRAEKAKKEKAVPTQTPDAETTEKD